MLVAVYGTLKRGGCNNQALNGCKFLGADVSYEISLYKGTHFPMALLDEHSQGSVIEVYDINQDVLSDLDYIEGYPVLYRRETITTRYGDALCYIFNVELENGTIIHNWVNK